MRRRETTPEMVQAIVALCGLGWTYQQIALAIDRSAGTVRRHALRADGGDDEEEATPRRATGCGVVRRATGMTSRAVAKIIAGDPDGEISDYAISLRINVSEQAVSDARRKAGLPSMMERRGQDPRIRTAPNLARVAVAVVAKSSGITVSDLTGREGGWKRAHARQTAALVLRRLGMSYPVIGLALGDRHHTAPTVPSL